MSDHSPIIAPSTFAFINDDIRNQLVSSREILEVAAKLQGVVAQIEDKNLRIPIYEAVQSLLQIANRLTVNANTTTSSASTSITRIMLK